MEAFDAAAIAYDQTFTHSCVGKAQRDQVWKYVDRYVTPNATKVLEINCGTGEDAHRWHQRQKSIVGTDLSPKMLEVARAKFPEIAFEQLDIERVYEYPDTFDTLFSNFGGLNCLSASALRTFFSASADKLEPGGKMVLVIMGKKCLWDQLYMVLKRRFNDRHRRNTDQAVEVPVDGEMIPTWYYSPAEIEALSDHSFRCIAKHPIGLFVPPSYLAPAFEKRKWSLGVAKWFDTQFVNPGLSNYADHYLMVLEKK